MCIASTGSASDVDASTGKDKSSIQVDLRGKRKISSASNEKGKRKASGGKSQPEIELENAIVIPMEERMDLLLGSVPTLKCPVVLNSNIFETNAENDELNESKRFKEMSSASTSNSAIDTSGILNVFMYIYVLLFITACNFHVQHFFKRIILH